MTTQNANVARDKVRSSSELQTKSLQRPVYGFSPSLVMVSHPNEGAAEAIGALRNHIMSKHMHEGRRALAVCAPTKGVGCTFVAANLAVSLAQVGVNTLLIDADLRGPSVHHIIRPPRLADGLRHCLSVQDTNFSDCVESDIQPNLSIMYSGGTAPNPQELLSGNRFATLIDHCMREYELTIIDTPPANNYADARRIAALAGYALVVARRDKTLVGDITTLSNQLRGDHASVVGSVFNEA